MASSHMSPLTVLTCKTMAVFLQITAVFCFISLLSRCSSAYKLHDTIRTLKEENLHLQNRLENLTRALRDLKHLLTEYSKGISTETHQMLEQALCLSELHGAAPSIFITPGCLLLLLSSLVSVMLSLLS